MRCIRPLPAGFHSDGTLNYNNKGNSFELEGIQFECRKCLACLLNQAREKAIRCVHEARMHQDSIFLTLTYADEHLKSPYLNYLDFQLFMKRLLEHVNRGIEHKENRKQIPFMVTGEYGDLNKRPHWHCILFNYAPSDAKRLRSTEKGDAVFTSQEINKLWPFGNSEFGSVTIDSAGYVARYGAKALGNKDPLFKPIHNTSKRHALGKSWIEKYYKHTFENGFIVLPDGSISKIPRYYVDWAKQNQPEYWRRYVTELRPKIIVEANQKHRKEELEFISEWLSRPAGTDFRAPLKRSKVKETILKQKFKQLQEYSKL